MDRYRFEVRTLVLVAAAVVLSVASVFGSGGTAAGAVVTCAERFPESEWTVLRSGTVTIESTGIARELGVRFNGEISLAAGWISSEVGQFTTTVCLVSPGSGFDDTRFEFGSRRFHAHSNLEQGLLVLSTERVGFVGPAASFALAHHALWQSNGSQPFPEPIAGVVGHWYRARMLERLDQYHHDMMLGNLFDTESIVDWTARSQEPIQDWDPESNFLAIGDFMDFAVASYGTDVLLETDGDTWSRIEGEWRVGLRNDLRGRDTDTTGWIGGVVLTVASVVVAAIAIALGLFAKYRRTERTETPPPIPGFFSEDEQHDAESSTAQTS